jgi:hypothetical protein
LRLLYGSCDVRSITKGEQPANPPLGRIARIVGSGTMTVLESARFARAETGA